MKSAISSFFNRRVTPSHCLDVKGIIGKIVLVVILAIVIGWLTFLALYHNKIENLQDSQQSKLISAVRTIEREIGNIEDTVRYLSSNDVVHTPLSGEPTNRIKQLQRYFVSFGSASRFISQIRWLDNSGQERVRVDFDDDYHRVIANERLQSKQSRYYFQQAMQVESPRIYVSKIDLNMEEGKLELPFKPTIRAALKTDAQNYAFEGLLVINYDLGFLLEKLRALQSPLITLELLDNQGFWLIHEDPSNEWGFALNQPDNRLENVSASAWESIQTANTASGSVKDQHLISFHRVRLQSGKTSHFNDVIVLVRTSQEKLTHLTRFTVAVCILTGLLVFVLGAVVIVRETVFQQKLLSVTAILTEEKRRLAKINHALEESFVQQQVLQNDLVETQKLASLGSLVAGVAHELNTPIGAAITSVSYCCDAITALEGQLDKGITKSDFAKAVVLIKEGTSISQSNLQRAASQIESFKRMAMERKDETAMAFSLNQVIGDLVSGVEASLGPHKPEITFRASENITMFGRPGVVSQAIQYLINNAIEHGLTDPELGRIDIIVSTTEDEHVCVVVEDNGVGVAPEFQDKLFQPFTTDQRSRGHTGLGLFFVHQWVTQILQGKISYRQSTSGGAYFAIVIPQRITL